MSGQYTSCPWATRYFFAPGVNQTIIVGVMAQNVILKNFLLGATHNLTRCPRATPYIVGPGVNQTLILGSWHRRVTLKKFFCIGCYPNMSESYPSVQEGTWADHKNSFSIGTRIPSSIHAPLSIHKQTWRKEVFELTFYNIEKKGLLPIILF